MQQRCIDSCLYEKERQAMYAVALKAVIILMDKLLSRFETRLEMGNFEYMGTRGIEQNVFRFKCKAGTFTIIFDVIPDVKNGGAEVKVTSTDIPFKFQFHPGIFPGQSFTAEGLGRYRA